jgi:hypothetical protein
MKAWRVGVRDGHKGVDAGFAVALAQTAKEARAAVVRYLKNDTAFGKPYEVSTVEAHENDEPNVVFMNWGTGTNGRPSTTRRTRRRRATALSPVSSAARASKRERPSSRRSATIVTVGWARGRIHRCAGS